MPLGYWVQDRKLIFDDVRALVERVTVSTAGADIRLRVEGLAGLVREPASSTPDIIVAA